MGKAMLVKALYCCIYISWMTVDEKLSFHMDGCC